MKKTKAAVATIALLISFCDTPNPTDEKGVLPPGLTYTNDTAGITIILPEGFERVSTKTQKANFFSAAAIKYQGYQPQFYFYRYPLTGSSAYNYLKKLSGTSGYTTRTLDSLFISNEPAARLVILKHAGGSTGDLLLYYLMIHRKTYDVLITYGQSATDEKEFEDTWKAVEQSITLSEGILVYKSDSTGMSYVFPAGYRDGTYTLNNLNVKYYAVKPESDYDSRFAVEEMRPLGTFEQLDEYMHIISGKNGCSIEQDLDLTIKGNEAKLLYVKTPGNGVTMLVARLYFFADGFENRLVFSSEYDSFYNGGGQKEMQDVLNSVNKP